jgi:hypothetical protein
MAHKEFESEPFQMLKGKFCVQTGPVPLTIITPLSKTQKVILLAEMQIWKNPIGRNQNFLSSSNLIGQNKPALDVCNLIVDTPSSQTVSSSRLFRAQWMVASFLKMYGCTNVKCNVANFLNF